jgi:hypothetical protein
MPSMSMGSEGWALLSGGGAGPGRSMGSQAGEEPVQGGLRVSTGQAGGEESGRVGAWVAR